MSIKISVQTSKHLSVPIIASIIVLDRDAIIKSLPKISDVDYMMNVASSLGFSIKITNQLTKFKKNGEISQYDFSSIEGNIRQNILLLPLCTSNEETIFPIPQGDVIGKRPIDGYFQLLRIFGFEVNRTLNSISVNETGRITPKELVLEVDSTGITIVAILMILKNLYYYRKNKIPIVTVRNISVDLEIEWFIHFINKNLNNGKISYYPQKRLLEVDTQSHLLDILKGEIPVDRVALFDKFLFANLFDKEIEIENISKNALIHTLGKGVEVLKEIGTNVLHNGASGLNNQNHGVLLEKKNINLVAEKYPKLSTDMLPLLTTLYTLKNFKVSIEDKYFEDRSRLLNEQLGKMKMNEKFIFESSNIRQTLCGLMAMVFSEKIEKVIDYNKSLYRGYEKNIVAKIEDISGIKISTIETKNKIEFTRWN